MAPPTQRRFVVLDRDGTIIVERHHLSDPQQVELLQEAGGALRKLQELGFGLVVITNQSAIGRGLFDAVRLEAIHQRLHTLLVAEGVRLDGLYYCPHVPDDHCPCRKPKPGLMKRAASELGFDPQRSFVIGDKPCDLELGRQVGATTFLVRTGYGAQFEAQAAGLADYVVDGMPAAVPIIAGLVRQGRIRPEPLSVPQG